jgi:hypothetical protein
MPVLSVVATDTYLAIGEAIEAAARDRSLVAVLGPPETGKSEAIDQHAPDHAVFLEVPAGATREQAIRTLFESLTGVREPSGLSRDLMGLAREEIHRHPRLLVVDPVLPAHEALLRVLFELWEAGEQFGCVMAGTEMSDRVLHRVAGLRSTVRVVRASPMTPSEVAECVPLLHPLYERADRDTLLRLDAHYAHGLPARWAHLTELAEALTSVYPTDTLTRALAEAMLASVLQMAS